MIGATAAAGRRHRRHAACIQKARQLLLGLGLPPPASDSSLVAHLVALGRTVSTVMLQSAMFVTTPDSILIQPQQEGLAHYPGLARPITSRHMASMASCCCTDWFLWEETVHDVGPLPDLLAHCVAGGDPDTLLVHSEAHAAMSGQLIHAQVAADGRSSLTEYTQPLHFLIHLEDEPYHWLVARASPSDGVQGYDSSCAHTPAARRALLNGPLQRCQVLVEALGLVAPRGRGASEVRDVVYDPVQAYSMVWAISNLWDLVVEGRQPALDTNPVLACMRVLLLLKGLLVLAGVVTDEQELQQELLVRRCV